MSQFVQVKVTGGKMLQLEKVDSVYKITGDFFCHPEEVIEDFETILNASISHQEKCNNFDEIFKSDDFVISGFAAKDLINLYDQIQS
jgi:hypothetical protein